MRIALLALLAGCYHSPPESTSLMNQSDRSKAPALTMTESGVGPIVSTTKATLSDLSAALIGYDVKEIDDPADDEVFDVYRNGERLLHLFGEEDGYDRVSVVQAVSSHVEISGHPWRVGSAFHDAAHLTDCECWGSNPTCFAMHEHIGVSFDVKCGVTMMSDRMLGTVEGLPIGRVIWSARGLGEDDPNADRD